MALRALARATGFVPVTHAGALALCALLFASLTQAEELFGPRVSLPLDHHPDQAPPFEARLALVSADFDLDGIPDLAVTQPIGSVLVAWGDGVGGVGKHAGHALPSSAPIDLVAVDLDRDGRPDLAVVDGSDDVVQVLLARERRQFQNGQTVTIAGRAAGIAAGDFDDDGEMDLALMLPDEDAVIVLRGDGQGGFAETLTAEVGNRPEGLAAADFDRDGRSDLIVVNKLDDSITLLRIRGDGLLASYVTIGVGHLPNDVVVGHLDSDGSVDAVVSNVGDSTISVLLGNDSGGLAERVRIGLEGSPTPRPGRMVLADRDGDERADLVVLDLHSDVLHLFRGDGTGSLIPDPALAVGGLPQDLVAAQLDNDGDVDLAVADGRGRLVVMPGDGLGGFETAPELETGARGCLVATDVDRDGLDDLVVLEAGSVRVLLGDGDGGLALVTTVEAVPGNCLTAAHLDNDAAVDLVVIEAGTIRVLWGKGQGDFTVGTTIDVGTVLHGVVAADFDNDGAVDLAVTDNPADEIVVLFNDGRRGFEQISKIRTCRVDRCGPDALLVVDLDRNGVPDLAVANINAALSVSVLLGDGLGGFTGPVELHLEDHDYFRSFYCGAWLVAGALDDDGHEDLALAHVCWEFPAVGHLATLLGEGNGVLQLHDDLSLQQVDGQWLGAADFNLDGLMDVVLTYRRTLSVGLLLGDGAGGFWPVPDVAIPGNPGATAIADFDGDGAPDLAVAREANPVQLRLNRLLDRADVDGSNRVDGFDVATLARLAGTPVGDVAYRREADVDLNREIEGTDLTVAAARFGEVVAPISVLRGVLAETSAPAPRTITLQPGESGNLLEGDLIAVQVHVQDVDLPAAAARFALTVDAVDGADDDGVLEWVHDRPGDFLGGGITQIYDVRSPARNRVEVAVTRVPFENRVVPGTRSLIELIFRAVSPGTVRLAFAGSGDDPVPVLIDDESIPLEAVEFLGEPTVTVAATVEGATGPRLAISPPSIDFGLVPLGATAQRKIRLTNIGFSDLEIREVTIADLGTGFTTFFTTPFSIPPKSYVLLTVACTAESAGDLTNTLLVESTDPGQVHRVALSARGAVTMGFADDDDQGDES